MFRNGLDTRLCFNVVAHQCMFDELLGFIQVQIKEHVAVRGANVSDVTP